VDGSKIFATTNPDSPLHYVKKEMLNGNNKDVTFFDFEMDDNPSLTTEYKDYLKRQYKGLWYQRFIEGKWVQAEGAVYDFFDYSRHVITEWPQGAREYVIGIDYGTTNPTGFLLLGYNPGGTPQIWIEKEYYWDSTKQQRQKTDQEYAEDYMDFIKGYYISGAYIDPAAASFKQALWRQGADNLIDAENEVIDGIRFVSSLFHQGTLKITAKCTHVIKEIQGYKWDPRSSIIGKDKPIKLDDHLLDALRYATYSHFKHVFDSQTSDEEIRRMEEVYRPRTYLHSTH
jgi:PBSX family phage terminase large subunit